MGPSIDVIVPVFNPRQNLETIIHNILDQEYVQVHVIIIDDASSSGQEVIEKLALEKKVSVYKHTHNRGGGHARNTGLTYAKSEYLAFCDSDDFWMAKKLDEQIKYMEKMKLSMTHTDILPVGVDGIAKERIKTSDKIDLKTFLMSTQIYCSTVCLHSSILKNATFGSMRKRHPFKFWVNILESGIISYRVPGSHCCTKYTIRSDSVSANRYSTAVYTLLAYLRYPKNKALAVSCLILRLLLNKNANSRILGKM